VSAENPKQSVNVKTSSCTHSEVRTINDPQLDVVDINLERVGNLAEGERGLGCALCGEGNQTHLPGDGALVEAGGGKELRLALDKVLVHFQVAIGEEAKEGVRRLS